MSVVRWIAAAVLAVLSLGACAPMRPAAPTLASPADLVVLGTASGLAALNTADGSLVYQAPNAVATPDGTFVGVDVPDGLSPLVISNDGRRVALGPRSDPADAWQPAGRERTRIMVADPSGAVPPRTFDLAGNYEPDAFATDNQHLFVLEYQPPQAPDRYLVRQLDLYTGTVSGVGSRSKTAVPEENMRGTRRMHVLSPDRQTLYTLYTHQPDHLHSRDLAAGLTASSGTVHAFVHVLSLSEGWAFCLDLPQPFGLGPATAHSLALSPDGNALYVSDRSSGSVARVDTNQLLVRATANAGGDANGASGLAAAQVGPDGSLFLGGGAEILVLDPKSLAVVRRLPAAGFSGGLGLSADGQRLFVSTNDSVLTLDPRTGAELARFAVPGTQRIDYVGDRSVSK